MKTTLNFGWIIGLLAGNLWAAADTTLPITVVNYSPLPVFATAIPLDEKQLDTKLGLTEGSPLRIHAADSTQPLPLTRGRQNGQPVLWLYVSMSPGSRLDLLAERADQWPDPASVVSAKAGSGELIGEIRNGVAGLTIGKNGWTLAFDPPPGVTIPAVEGSSPVKPGSQKKAAAHPANPLAMINSGQLEFWVDNQNRGRISNAKPADLGLAHFPTDGREAKCEASVTDDGRPCLRLVTRLSGLAQAMTVTETFELLPGLPILICRIQWQNDGDQPLWIAYVRSGDGIHGKWSAPLMAGPLIERKKSAIQGDLNGSETRPAWLHGLCRISMESLSTGCGVGLSTLLRNGNVGQGSMIWGCGASGFQCNLIDPVQGQFPFLVKPHSTLENGNAFLITQNRTSVFRQVVDLWSALAAGRLPALASPCALFVDGEPILAQSVGELGNAPGLLQSRGDLQLAALRMDFNKYYQCRLTVESTSPQEPIELSVQPLVPGQSAISLLRADKPGEFKIDLNPAFKKPDEIPFLLKIKRSGAAQLKGLAICETLPVSPEMLSPMPDASITDIATMFRWKPIPTVVDYDLQWSASPEFTSPVEVRVAESHEQPWYLPPDGKLPAPGKWYWRIRGVKGSILGEWSAPRSFTVNNDHSTKPLRRPPTAQAPLFTLEASHQTDFTIFHPEIPADIAPYVGIIAEGFVDKLVPINESMRGVEKFPGPFLIRSHPPTQISLADMEWVCQHCPNFIGMQGGETLSKVYEEERGKSTGDAAYHRRMTRLGAKYGLFYQEADGTYADDKWQELWDKQGAFVREFGRYMIFSQKNNIIRRQFYSQSSALGLWLGGISLGHGAWEDGGFYWQNAGFTDLGKCEGERRGILSTMPRIFWDLVCVMGISRGCSIYSLDGQTLMYSAKGAARDPKGPWRSAIWSDTGETTDTFKRFVVPLIRGTVAHQLVPTREQVLHNVKLAVYNDRKVSADVNRWPHYMEFGPLYASTYGFRKMGNIDGQLWEFFPNTGRYYFIPVLPQGNEPVAAGIQNLPVSQLQDPAKVKEIFDAAYPKWYDGDGFACRIGDTLTIQNSHENEDQPEQYSIPLNHGPIQTFAGTVQPHSFLIGKCERKPDGDSFWFQANTEYPDRDTVVTLTCSHQPECHVEPAAAAKNIQWDAAKSTLMLQLSHQQGAVEVTVK